MPSMRNLQTAVINNSATAQTTLINNAGHNGYLYVWDAYMTIATSTNVVFYNGAVALTGNMNFLAGSAFDQSGLPEFPMWTIDPNANLSMTLSTAAQVSGWITYSY